MKLPKSAYNWALKHLINEGDTDLFPTPFEINAIKQNWSKVLDDLIRIDVENYHWNSGQRFVVPKDVLAFRVATQLDPIDSLILAAIIRKYGEKIESRRRPYNDQQVFSYRFAPTGDGRFYGSQSTWHTFWQASLQKASSTACQYVVVTDITDYYNQIYHHVLENQLRVSKLPLEIFKAIKNFLSSMTDGVSRGIPVGPHSVHLLAEAALITTDNSLLARGYNFCRYVDDMHIFCPTKETAEEALYDFVEVLDKQQKLTVQKQKTKILGANEFCQLANNMLVDRPINAHEEELLEVISRHSSDDPYRWVSLHALTAQDLQVVSQPILERLLEIYLTQEPINYPRIGWLIRRLTQLGAPGAFEYILNNLEKLTPILGEVARYIMRASPNYAGNIAQAGAKLITALGFPLIRRSEYLQIVLMDIFGHVPSLDHTYALTSRYDQMPPVVRRQVVRAATAANQSDWLRERKSEFHHGDPWLRRAIVAAAPQFPGDETEHWISQVRGKMSGFEKIVALWACKGAKLKLGEIKIV